MDTQQVHSLTVETKQSVQAAAATSEAHEAAAGPQRDRRQDADLDYSDFDRQISEEEM